MTPKPIIIKLDKDPGRRGKHKLKMAACNKCTDPFYTNTKEKLCFTCSGKIPKYNPWTRNDE